MTLKKLTDIQAIAFDLDGTLVDSVGGLADALDHALINQQLPAAGKELVSTWVGNGVDIMIERALTWANIKITPKIKNNIHQLFDKIPRMHFMNKI